MNINEMKFDHKLIVGMALISVVLLAAHFLLVPSMVGGIGYQATAKSLAHYLTLWAAGGSFIVSLVFLSKENLGVGLVFWLSLHAVALTSLVPLWGGDVPGSVTAVVTLGTGVKWIPLLVLGFAYYIQWLSVQSIEELVADRAAGRV